MTLDVKEHLARIDRHIALTKKVNEIGKMLLARVSQTAEEHRRRAEAPWATWSVAIAEWVAAGIVCGGSFTATLLLMRALGVL
jgi:hypothetical protein